MKKTQWSRIIQEAIPDTVYRQWITTQLMGGTAPDLMEIGHYGMFPKTLWVSYYNRYFIPLTRYIVEPNPYNKDNAFCLVNTEL